MLGTPQKTITFTSVSKAKERIILGIDPGTVVMGFGVICIKGHRLHLVSAGVLKLHKKDDHHDRLKDIFETVVQLIEQHHPDELSIEEPFFGKNVQSMLKLGRAQGVAMAAALSRQIPVFGYSPRLIKQSITGKGAASKEQVAAMLQRLLHFEQSPRYLDATDAVGVALCHYFQSKVLVPDPGIPAAVKKQGAKKSAKAYSGWSAFLNDHPGRIKGG
ncbi:MAG: crossover junction endodeoxyribonuclease RuvC [Bacteroidia bacterium]|nr:crossover junction endodeoxyribonuclease RuvC [Bacteroidia bacterium]